MKPSKLSVLFEIVVEKLISCATRAPYVHIGEEGDRYMERYWLVPRLHLSGYPELDVGCGPVSFWHRPFSWVIQKLGREVRLHRIMRSDRADAWHDHPFDFFTIRLRGGYWEHLLCRHDNGLRIFNELRYHAAGTMSFRRCTDFHILELDPGTECWTLVICSSKKQSWGYKPLDTVEKVYWRDFHGDESKT